MVRRADCCVELGVALASTDASNFACFIIPRREQPLLAAQTLELKRLPQTFEFQRL